MPVLVRVEIEAPDCWGPTRALIGQLRDLGYEVTEWRVLGVAGRSVLEIR
jgi:hypothetical protein